MLAVLACSSPGLVVPLSATRPAASLAGVSLPRASDGEQVDLGSALAQSKGRTMLVLGCHAGDFNTVEYVQRVRAFWPQLQAKGVDRCLVVVNGQASSCAKLAELLDPPAGLELLSDPTGDAGRRFGVSRGWRPDDERIPAAIKLFVVGIGLGPPWGTLPAVLTGYLGNPGGRRDWIEAALKQGQEAGRRPGPLPDILELSADGEVRPRRLRQPFLPPTTRAHVHVHGPPPGRVRPDASLSGGAQIVGNKFDDFPLVGGWGRRPLELATLRLQNLLDIQMKHWDALKPVDDRCLTQLGGCAVVGPGGEAVYAWVDEGLCDVPDFHELLEAL